MYGDDAEWLAATGEPNTTAAASTAAAAEEGRMTARLGYRRVALKDMHQVVGPFHLGCSLAPHIPMSNTNHCPWCGTLRLRRAEARRRHKSQWKCHACALKYTAFANSRHEDYRPPLRIDDAQRRLERVLAE
jgi:predicted RNA-binding Zn-ribbon protein involved in translation (DUF1610 family)